MNGSKLQNVLGIGSKQRTNQMKKKVKKIAVYTVSEKENGELKIMAKNDFSSSEAFAVFAEKKTGIERQKFITKGRGKKKKTVAVKPTRNANYVSCMKKLKATIKPYWIDAGYTAKRFNVRFSQLVNIVYGVPMQLQVHNTLPKGDTDYTIDIAMTADKAVKPVKALIEALIEKHGRVWIETIIASVK